ncbi:MAG: carboxypeptidase-like regulatory domain-containing protein [Planctomycetota bacterium]
MNRDPGGAAVNGCLWRRLVPALALPVAFACLAAAGCSRSDRPPLGRVGGSVTLDGSPLAGALVVFIPDGPGRSALATTDVAGRYELTYLRDIAGANYGSHTVRITTATEERGGKEILPDRYHVKSELKATVQPGSNTLDFPLQSK